METREKTNVIIALCTVFLLQFFVPHINAQKIWEVRKGTIRAQGNLAPGYLFSQKYFAAYVTGDMDLFLDDRAAFTGSVWVSFNTAPENKEGLRANHSLFGGMNYHFLKPQRFDPYVGLTPGVALVRSAYYDDSYTLTKSNFSIAPLISLSTGFNYYVGSFFHFFVKAQGVVGQTFGNAPSPSRLDELKVTLGLGWNFRAWKPKKTDVWKQKKQSVKI
ncbi:MAG: hypothetical protein R2777_03555 [Chitinophagales bacterium]